MPSHDAPADALAAALALVERTQAEPRVVESEALRMLATLEPSEPAAVAHWAAGLALREMGRLDGSRRELEAGRRLAGRLGLEARAAEIGESLALTYFLLGNHREALRQADLAAPHLRGGRTARLLMQRGLILQRMGRTDEALETFRRALPGMARAGDRLGEARLRINRSNLRTYRGELAAARTDLERAHDLAVELDQGMLIGMCAHNLGFVAGRAGDVPTALRWYDEAAEVYRANGVEGGLAAVLLADRAELLLEAGLTTEATRLAARAVAVLDLDGNAADLAEAQLLQARALLSDGRPEPAMAAAEAASDGFRAQRRKAWTDLARYVDLQARFGLSRQSGEVPPDVLPLARRVVGDLSAAGWRTESLHAAVMAGRIALATGHRRIARSILTGAQKARHSGTASARAQAWHAAALMRLVDGNPRGARRAVEAGMRVVEDHRAGMGATELRAQAGVHGADLAEMGVRIALEGGRADDVLRWADRFRAVTMTRPEARPASSAISGLLTELRRLSRSATEASLRGAPDRRLEAQRARVEDEVRRLTLQQGGGGTGDALRRLDGLVPTLGDRLLVEYFSTSAGAGAVVIGRGRATVHPLSLPEDLAAWIDLTRFDLNRLATGRGSPTALAAAVASLADTSRRLQEALLDPLELGGHVGPDGAGPGLVIVPTGALHGVPWRALPSLVAGAFVVAPSAATWLTMRPDGASADRLFISGPDLTAARSEVERLSRTPGGRRLTGRSATVGAVLAAISGADVVHLAAHGTFRPDNPMFSSLQLADGELTVYELEQLSEVPSLFVLPACDAAVSGVRAGDELLGLAAALLRLGASTLVAPIVPVADSATRDLMVAFHRRLAAGAPTDRALADAGNTLDDGDPAQHAVRRSFLVLGAA